MPPVRTSISSSGRSRRRRSCSAATASRPRSCAPQLQQARVPVVFGSDEVVGPKEFYNAAFVMDARRRDSRLVPQDATGAVRGVHPRALAAVLCPAAGRGILRLQRRPAADAAAGRGCTGCRWRSATRRSFPGCRARPCGRAVSSSRRSPTTRGTAPPRRPTSISSRRGSVPWRRGGISCARPTPASAAWSIRTGACRCSRRCSRRARGRAMCVGWTASTLVRADRRRGGLGLYARHDGAARVAGLGTDPPAERHREVMLNAGMPECRERCLAASRRFQHFGIRHFVRRTARSRCTELSGGVNVAFVKEEAYKRFEDLQRRAVELGRYL